MQGAIGASYFKLRPCQKLPIVHESFGPFPLSTPEFRPELSFFQFRGILGVYWGYIGIMDKKMETTGIIGVI